MQKLKYQNLSHLSESLLKTLGQNRIITILDFLQEDVSKLSALTKLSLPEILDIRNEIFNKYSAPLICGTTLLTKEYKTSSLIKTGIERLDAITNGGIPIRCITEICGLADSGKSQLSFQLAINCVKEEANTVLYVDTKGDFSAIRIQRILDAQKIPHKEMAVIMQKIKVVSIWTLEDLVELFKGLKNKTCVIENLALIIVDSLPCLMFQYLGDENKMGLSLLNILVNYSRFIGNEFNIGIIYINIQTRWLDNGISEIEDDADVPFFREQSYNEKRNRCLGKYWDHIPGLLLLLEKIEENSNEDDYCIQIKVSAKTSNTLKSDSGQCILKLSGLGVY